MDIEDRNEYDVEMATEFNSEGGHDTHEERGNWGRHIEFVLATIGFAVGLGNVWRFPYLAQKNGGEILSRMRNDANSKIISARMLCNSMIFSWVVGSLMSSIPVQPHTGAFLIPYFLCLAIAGIPIFFLELGIGQRLRRGSVACWNEISPYLGGIGIACMVVSFFVSVYYNMIIGWSFYYMFISMQEKLPYQSCDGYPHITKVNIPVSNATNASATNMTDCERLGSTSYYWYHENLQISAEMTASSDLLWHLCLVLLFAWIIVFAVMMKGLAAAGKVVYFTSLFPYLVLFVFLIRGLTLEGAGVGIRRMFEPKFEHLKNPIVWLEAATQIFFSLSLAFGGLVSMASYNPVHNNCCRDSIVVSLINCFTSLLASLVVFAVLGFKATQKCKGEKACDIEKALSSVASGAGLTFIAFTEAIVQMPAPHVWAILFFMMLITLGFGSMFGTMEGLVTPLFDSKIFNVKKPYITGVVCVISYFIGLAFCTKSGVYWLELFNDYSGTIPLLTIAFFELIAVSWVYGLDKFERDIEYMLKAKPSLYWKVCWKFVAPIFILVVFWASVIGMIINGISYERWDVLEGKKVKTSYPGYAYFVIVLMIFIPLICIPGVAMIRYFGYCTYKSRGAAAIDMDEDEPTGTIVHNLSRIPLTSDEEAPGRLKDDNDEAESLLDHKDSGRESVL